MLDEDAIGKQIMARRDGAKIHLKIGHEMEIGFSTPIKHCSSIACK